MARTKYNTANYHRVTHGIVHQSGDNIIHLSLEQVDVHAQIIDVSATVTLTQKFWQNMPTPTARAKYVFPIPAGAAICGFEMRTESGTVITAVAKETETARKEHEEAIQRGNMTGLVELVAGDVFTISLGCLPALQMVTTKLTYVMSLLEDDFTDQVRLLLPVCIGMRYGTPPAGVREAAIVPEERIKISVDVFMKGEIMSITSPSHPTFSIVDGIALSDAPGARCKTAQYHSPYFLARDFILSIKSEGLDAPRCFAQRNAARSVAMQLTLVPNITLPNVPQQEYIFLVDRSGSMNGGRIETAKRALMMLLRALPTSGTTFNIFSFGSLCDSLWDESQAYDEESLRTATEHVDDMGANYGGTQIRSALEAVFKTRCVTLPTACFVLTDGGSYDVDGTISQVTEAVSAARAEAPLRVYTLGIGESTSTAMCEGIARSGNGICLMAASEESIVAKCTKLVKASRTPIFDVDIDWGAPVGSQEGNLQTVTMLQGPSRVSSLFNHARFTVFALSQDPSFAIPEQVNITAKCRGVDKMFQLPVPVETLQDAPAHAPQRPMIHTLAAKRIITDLEDHKHPSLPDPKSAIIHLGEQYQLASRYTSFIAVEERKDPQAESSVETSDSRPQDRAPSPDFAEPGTAARGRGLPPRVSTGGKAPRMQLASSAARKAAAAPVPAAARRNLLETDSPERDRYRESERVQPGRACKRARFDELSAEAGRDKKAGLRKRKRSRPSGAQMPEISLPRRKPVEDDATQLVRLQSFDGSFAPSNEFAVIVGQAALDARKDVESSTVWATLLAIVYLQKHMKDEPELMESLVEKAMEYVRQSCNLDIDSLLSVARDLVL